MKHISTDNDEYFFNMDSMMSTTDGSVLNNVTNTTNRTEDVSVSLEGHQKVTPAANNKEVVVKDKHTWGNSLFNN